MRSYLVESKNEHCITQQIEFEEFFTAINQLSTNKAAGINGVTVEMIKNSPSIVQDWLCNCLNCWLELNEVPKCILRSQIWLIPKGLYDGNPVNTRPINLIDVTRKLFSMILARRLSRAIELNNLLKGINFGFREGMSTIDGIKSLQLIIEHAHIKNKKLCVVLLDIKNAYDSLENVHLIKALNELNIDYKYRLLLVNIMRKRRSKILTSIGPTAEFRIRRGLEQGDPSSPLLWNIFYEIILKKLNEKQGYNFDGINIPYMAYADDVILIAETEAQMEELLIEVNVLLT